MRRRNKRKRRSKSENENVERDTEKERTNPSSSDVVECFSWDPSVAQEATHASKAKSPSTMPNVLSRPIMEKVWQTLQTIGRLHIQATATPTSIQFHTWPRLLPSLFKTEEANVTTARLILQSPTGSGKTLAYGLPLVYRALASSTPNDDNREGSSALVLAPTRELAIQIGKNLKSVTKALQRMPDFLSTGRCVHVATLYGGLDRQRQATELKDLGAGGILICTTGRLLDLLQALEKDSQKEDTREHLEHGQIVATFLKTLSYWVVDEADRMATHSDLSEQIDMIVSRIPTDAVRVFASATWPNDTDKWKEWLWSLKKDGTKREPCTVIRVNSNALKSSSMKKETPSPDNCDTDDKRTPGQLTKEVVWSEIPSNITHTLHVCAEHKKPRKLMSTLQKLNKNNITRQKPLCIVFFGTIKTLQYCYKLLSKERISCLELHSHMPQHVRERNIQAFSSGKATLLLATDICARGVHVTRVRAVVQYDFPGNMEQYIHRCGRAGRDGKPATVFSFFTRSLQPLAPAIVQLLQKSKQWVDPNLLQLTQASTPKNSPAKRRKKDSPKPSHSMLENTGESDEDSFAGLEACRIVLKRSTNVSDRSDDEDEDLEGAKED